MNMLRFSCALQAPFGSCTFTFGNTVLSSPSCSPSTHSNSCSLWTPLFAISRSQGLPTNGKREIGELSRDRDLKSSRPFDFARFPDGRVLEVRSFICAALGNSSNEEPAEQDSTAIEVRIEDSGLVSGSPIVIVEAPALLKTAEPMPMMRPNRGLLKPGDAGRVIDRRPKNMWAVRFAVGAYLIDRKCFEPLDLQ